MTRITTCPAAQNVAILRVTSFNGPTLRNSGFRYSLRMSFPPFSEVRSPPCDMAA